MQSTPSFPSLPLSQIEHIVLCLPASDKRVPPVHQQFAMPRLCDSQRSRCRQPCTPPLGTLAALSGCDGSSRLLQRVHLPLASGSRQSCQRKQSTEKRLGCATKEASACRCASSATWSAVQRTAVRHDWELSAGGGRPKLLWYNGSSHCLQPAAQPGPVHGSSAAMSAESPCAKSASRGL
jgi:hypothetical protein